MGKHRHGSGGIGLPLDLIGHALTGFINTHKTELGLIKNKCTLCGKCQKVCKRRAIDVNPRLKKWCLYPNRCSHCLYCLSSCPTEAITLESRF